MVFSFGACLANFFVAKNIIEDWAQWIPSTKWNASLRTKNRKVKEKKMTKTYKFNFMYVYGYELLFFLYFLFHFIHGRYHMSL